jgi:uncharacterized protein
MSTIAGDRRSGFWKGADGLRSGWAILLFMIIGLSVTAILMRTVFALGLLARPDMTEVLTRLMPGLEAAVFAAVSCGMLVAYGVMSRIDRRPWRDHGLGGSRALVRFGQGALSGAVLMSLLVGALVLTHAMKTGSSGIPARSLIGPGLQWAAMFLPAAFVEEMIFRGYPFFRLARAISPTWAAIVMSLLFGLAHQPNGGEGLAGILLTVVIGLVFNLAAWRTGSLWWSFGAHAAWNWTQTFVFGCSNSGLAGGEQWLVSVPTGPVWLSGGTTGPEGSVLVLPLMALMAWTIVLTLPVASRSGPEAALPSSV